MPSPGIVEALDVIEHVRFGLVSRAVRLVRRPFGLERGEEVLHRGIVPDVVGPAHATDHAVVGQEPLEGLTGVLATPIGVVQYGLGLPRRQMASTSASVTSAWSWSHAWTSRPPVARRDPPPP